MTEAEWLASANPIRMVERLKGDRSDRKLRLIASGCVRLFRQYLDADPARLLVEAFEDYADGRGSHGEIVAMVEPVHRFAQSVVPPSPKRPVLDMVIDLARLEINGPNSYRLARVAVSDVGRVVIYARSEPKSNDDMMQRAVRRAATVVRDIFGNPFRPAALSLEWRTDTAVTLARQMYESREFGAMPILADALQDAGCDNDDILNHCRSGGPHVRGCWVCDLVLSKE